ncbi:MAG: family 16 glycosylhydrolase [Candidatus Omnitrophica bacterium]|nr:family 16 glycosylhydrolase [Candidatus Omnitrophota bacterium]MBU1925927.1 family 16 glycosylhydrolase [Candidatus Omnitrophota bacterium]
MKKRWIFWIGVVLASIILAGSRPAIAQEAGSSLERPGWYLVWHDEFEKEVLDESKWRREDAALVKNNELQYYAPNEVYVKNGYLVLRSRKHPFKGKDYTSGLVDTKGRLAFQYGRVEIRAKLPKGQGIWPAEWLMPESGDWPPEIDIVELLGHSSNTVHMSLHWGVWPDKKCCGKIFQGPDFSQDFHIFALEWDENKITWFVDGIERHSIDHDIPREPFYLILNTAVGGEWPGNPNSRTTFPQYHTIDYVRVYAKDIPGTYFLTTSALNGDIYVQPRQGRYAENTQVALSAKHKIGYLFSCWSGDLSGAQNPVTVIMDGHKKITANFAYDPQAPRLISRGKKTQASSWEKENLSARKVVDGDPNSRWSSEFSDPQWLAIDLGRAYNIQAIRLAWEVAYAKKYNIQVSHNGKTWRTVYKQNNGKGGTEEITKVNARARYVRLYGIKRAREWGYSLWEFEVFGRAIGRKSPPRQVR